MLQDFNQPFPARQLSLGRGIQVTAESGKGFQFSKLGQVQPQGAGHLLHGFYLGGTADPGYGKTDINRRSDTGEKQARFKIYLTVCNRNNIGGDIGRHITGLGFNDRQGRQRTGAKLVIQFSRTLEQTGMVVENIARISLTARRTSQQQGNLPVGGRLFGKIVINNQGVLAFITEIFSHGAAGIRGNKLQGRRITGTGRYDGGVFHGAVFFQDGMDLGNRRLLLTAGHIDAVNIGILLG